MTPEILTQLLDRLHNQPHSLDELHKIAVAAGSSWSQEQVALLLSCLPNVAEQNGTFRSTAEQTESPAVKALLALATVTPIPAAVFVRKMPPGVLVTPAALCEMARNHPKLELVGAHMIRLKP